MHDGQVVVLCSQARYCTLLYCISLCRTGGANLQHMCEDVLGCGLSFLSQVFLDPLLTSIDAYV